MSEKTDSYLQGMEAVNNFYAMLYSAMLEGMEGVLLSKSGAYVWRGFRIDKYQELAYGRYYCLVYPGDPDIFQLKVGSGKNISCNAFTCRELVFEESYNDPHHKPFDDRETKHCIKAGNYYYPFKVSLDLYRSRFFLLDVNEQLAMLKNFVSMAAQQAIIWQRSEARPRVTNLKYLNGKKQRRSPMKNRPPFRKIGVEFLDVWKLHNNLFSKLTSVIGDMGSNIVEKPILYLRPNANINNYNFRGYRLKFDGLFPGKKSDYRWEIHYETPEVLKCFSANS